jgi:HTH-type transcriptional regulator/antitoxin HigA
MYEKGWKQKQLAEILGISEASISGLLSGRRKLNLDLARKLHTKLEVDAHFLLISA